MKFKNTVAAAIGSLVFGSSAFAGFTAGTGPDVFAYTGAGTAGSPAIGGNIKVTNQPLATYNPDTAADPQIIRTPIDDLPNFLFSFSVNVNAVFGTSIVATGTYDVDYDLGSNGTPDISVSHGLATLFLQPDALIPGRYTAAGTLQQQSGPANPAFRDLAYGNNAVNILLQGGVYLGGTSAGTTDLILRQNALAPEPTTLAALAGASILGFRRRRA